MTELSDAAEAFADQFTRVFQMEPQSKLPFLNPELRVEDTIEDIVFSQDKIQQAIKELKNNSLPSQDI